MDQVLLLGGHYIKDGFVAGGDGQRRRSGAGRTGPAQVLPH
jgi:hypothetical protein